MKIKIRGGNTINTDITQEVQLIKSLTDELYGKISKLENKKNLYKNMHDLTLIEINTIIAITDGKPISMSEIANSLGVSFGTPTVTIDRLMAKGYVERLRDEADRRQVFVKLSEKGKGVYESIIKLRNNAAEKIFGILSDEEKKMLIKILSQLNNSFYDVFK